MITRTHDEINRQIEGLKKMKEWLPAHSFFGDENWAKIDAQIDILDGTKTMDDMYEDPEKLEEGEPDWIYLAAQEADNWLTGDKEEDLFETR